MSATTHQSLTVGPLKLGLEFDPQGRLRGVTIPEAVPADLDVATFGEVLAELKKFPLALEGPPFRKKVWEQMLAIPWGQALTYGELAAAVGNPGASRAVGTACATNRLPLIVPCHRVLAEAGPGGFACGLAWKAKLLELETEPRP
jgi:methylated-DNA-[protein]-cysteine S-methyltransferase